MIRSFTEKLIYHYNNGDVPEAILLATTEVNARWFQPLLQFHICIPDHRVNFLVDEKLKKYSQMFGTAFVYLGPHVDHFDMVFSQFGDIITSIRPVQKAVTQQSSLWQEVPLQG